MAVVLLPDICTILAWDWEVYVEHVHWMLLKKKSKAFLK